MWGLGVAEGLDQLGLVQLEPVQLELAQLEAGWGPHHRKETPGRSTPRTQTNPRPLLPEKKRGRSHDEIQEGKLFPFLFFSFFIIVFVFHVYLANMSYSQP